MAEPHLLSGIQQLGLDRRAATRIVRRVTGQARIENRITPHSLHQSLITAALDAGVVLRDLQEAASHTDPRTTVSV